MRELNKNTRQQSISSSSTVSTACFKKHANDLDSEVDTLCYKPVNWQNIEDDMQTIENNNFFQKFILFLKKFFLILKTLFLFNKTENNEIDDTDIESNYPVTESGFVGEDELAEIAKIKILNLYNNIDHQTSDNAELSKKIISILNNFCDAYYVKYDYQHCDLRTFNHYFHEFLQSLHFKMDTTTSLLFLI